MIIDDHPVARLAVRMLLEKDGHSVVAECGDGIRALRTARDCSPEMIVVDLDIPGMSGIELIERLRIGGFMGGLLVLTGRDNEHYLSRCMNVGADGFVSKRHNLDELTDAVRVVMRGYGYFPSRRQHGSMVGKPDEELEAINRLTSRELQVLQYLARGLKVIDIASIMHISNKTVSTYKSRLSIKLELRTNLDLIDFARRHHLD
ncbi:response regulator [Erwinia tasmaniensis]|uniref:response regulator n=1 Tax=Erwinia tasmaniensis TaxID=338565 RepID=UPI003A4DBA48